MRFKAPKTSLATALDRVARVVRSNPKSVDILQCVKIESYGGNVYIIATGAMASTRVMVQGASILETGAFAVALDRFRDRVAKAGGDILIETEEGSVRIVSSDDQRLGLKTNDLREFPDVEWVLSEESYGLPKKELISLFKLCNSLAASSSALTPAFLQASLRGQKMWVANGVSYHVFDVECNPELVSSIPTLTLSSLVGFIQEASGDTVWLSQNQGEQVVVSVGSDQFQTTPLSVEFPDLEPMFNRVKISATSQLSLSRNGLMAELSKAKTSVDGYGRVYLTIEGQGLTRVKVEARSDIGDWYESYVSCMWTGTKGRNLTLNLDSFYRFLQSYNSGEDVNLFVGDDFKSNLSAIYCSEETHSGLINQFRI